MSRRYSADKARERREWYLAHGICPECGARDLAPGHRLCEPCYAKNKVYMERRYNRLRDAGVCVTCGVNVVDDPRYLTCAPCRARRSQYYKVHRRKRG